MASLWRSALCDATTLRFTLRSVRPTPQIATYSASVTHSMLCENRPETTCDGKLTRTARPPSGIGSAVMEAPCAETMARTIERPSP